MRLKPVLVGLRQVNRGRASGRATTRCASRAAQRRPHPSTTRFRRFGCRTCGGSRSRRGGRLRRCASGCRAAPRPGTSGSWCRRCRAGPGRCLPNRRARRRCGRRRRAPIRAISSPRRAAEARGPGSRALFWSSISELAISSLRWSLAISLWAASSSWSFLSSLGLRPGLRASSPTAPLAPNCLRHDERCEL